MADLERNLRVFDRDSTNTCRIANLKAGGERATKTAQSTYSLCCDTIRTQILNWSQNGELEMPGFWWLNWPISNGPGFSCGNTCCHGALSGGTGPGTDPAIWTRC